MRLTNQTAGRLELPAGKTEIIAFDDALPGFGVRVRQGGARTWIVQYRVDRGQRRITLGKVGVVQAEQARQAAKTTLAEVQLGNDPQAEREASRAAAVHTLGAVSTRYLDHVRPGMRPGSYDGVERHFRLHWKPLAGEPIGTLNRKRIAERLLEIEKAHGAVTRNRARSSLSALYVWAMSEGLVETNPVVGTNKAAEKSRERVLTGAELAAVWNGCGDDSDYARIVRLLILTGQRREEVAAIRESEIERDRKIWHLPGDRTKNHLPHDVPLSDVALAVLPPLRARGTRDLLFGEGDGPYSGWSRSKDRLDSRLGFDDWTLHDLRRTVATGMGDIGVQPHIVEAVLNHVSGAKRGVAGIYNRAQYAAEKRQALERWAEHVAALVAGKPSNVVPMAG